MDPKSQKVKLNDGHFIPVLGFGTYAPPEVTVVVWGWDINSSGCTWAEGTWVVKHWAPVWLWVGHVVPPTWLEQFPLKEEKTFSFHSASWSEAVLTCRLLWVSFQFLSLSQIGRRGETQLSRILSAALLWRWLQWWGLSVYLINSITLSSFQKAMTQRYIWGGRSCRWVEWKIMGMNCFDTVECLLDGRQETLQLCFASYFCFCLKFYS